MSWGRKYNNPGGLSFDGQSTCTQQHLAKMTDVNAMLERALRGDTSVFRRGMPIVDATTVPSELQEVLNGQIKARNAYYALPPAVREAYPTPEAFFNACHDKTQIEKLRELGLVEKPAEDAPVRVEVVTPKGGEPSKGEPAPAT